MTRRIHTRYVWAIAYDLGKKDWGLYTTSTGWAYNFQTRKEAVRFIQQEGMTRTWKPVLLHVRK